jgi:hypothetical protein
MLRWPVNTGVMTMRQCAPLIMVLALIALAGCTTPFPPIQAGTTAAVMVEDQFEDPEQDAQDTTFFEFLDDLFSAPMNMMKMGLTAQAAFFGSLGDMFVGNDVNFTKRVQTVGKYLPVTYSSPPPAPPRQLLPSEMPGSPFAMKK